jgi:hypothetical protein
VEESARRCVLDLLTGVKWPTPSEPLLVTIPVSP